MLSGFVVEHYQVVLLDAAQRSIEQMTRSSCEALCAQQVPGDTYRNLRDLPEFSGRTFKHVLVPVWLLTYTYGAHGLPGAGERLHGEDGRHVSDQPLAVMPRSSSR